MTDMVRSASAMAEAVKILAQNDNWRRAQAVHHPGTGGRCASCGQRRPCTIASLAVAAEATAAREAAQDARALERAVRALIAPTSRPARTRVRPLSAETGGAA